MRIYNKIKQHIFSFIIIFIAFIMILSFSEDNVINPQLNYLKAISPQGYAFFTRNPREAQLFIYKIKNNTIEEDLNINSSSFEMLFGISRKNRRINLDMNEVILKLNYWKEYNNIDDIKSVRPDTIVTNSKDSKKNDGTFLIIKEERIPWAWSSKMKKPKKQFRLISLK